MIDLRAMLATIDVKEPVVVFDVSGVPDWAQGAGNAPALLLVRPVTDAVKDVAARRVLASLDRDGLWSVQGVALALRVIEAIGPETITAVDLIAAVSEAGFDWTVIEADLPGHR